MARLIPDREAALFYEQEIKGASIDGSKGVRSSRKKGLQRTVEAVHEDLDDLTGESESEEADEQSKEVSEDDSTSSGGVSEGVPMASAPSPEQEAGRGDTKRSKPGTAQAITEDGSTSKIGVVFSRILEKETKTGVLAGSKSVQKRRREDEAEAAQQQEAKQQRHKLTHRSHKPVLPKGHDPAQDAREKTLMTVATKGVVQLFNALSKAQQARWSAEVQGEKTDKVVKASKAALLQVLKPSEPKEEAGWKVLQKGFTGFKDAKMKMKDFDKQESSESQDLQDQPVEPLPGDDEVESW